MKNIIKIKELRLLNFKGAADVTVRFNDGKTVISGANGTGKSTVFDAFTWLLFDRDSRGRADFDVKTLDGGGNVIPRLEHSVEGVFDVNGCETRLRKGLREKWVKRRGTAEEDFTGNETVRFIDDVPFSLKDWNARIAEICDVEKFPLLTNPGYFTGLKADEQRRLLGELVGEITFAELNGDGRLTRIAAKKTEGVKIKDFLKTVRGEKERSSAELKSFQPMIEERRRDIAADCDIDSARRALAAAKSRMEEARKVAEVEDERRLSEEREARSVRLQLSRLRTRAVEREEALRNEATADWRAWREAKAALERKRAALLSSAANVEAEANIKETDIARMERDLDALRGEYRLIRDRRMPDSATVCPTCGRPFDDEKTADISAAFNARRAEDLRRNNERGLALKTDLEAARRMAEELRAEVGTLRREAEEVGSRPEMADRPLPEWRYTEGSDEAMEALKAEEAELTAKLADGVKMSDEACAQALELARNEVAGCEAVVRLCEKSVEAEARIAELESRMRACADGLAAAERDEDDIVEWIRRYHAKVEERVNVNFDSVKFKLFEQQVNGGVADICTATVGGVPFNSLNTAARITAGLEIIGVFQRHLGTSLPVFADNAEAVNVLPTMDCQVVELRVTDDHQMTVE